ncbi:MAG: TolB family protein, partial [Longimicrobiales bacterium]
MAFTSYARLIPADTDDRSDVYVLDRTTGTASLESVGLDRFALNTDCAQPRISDDGRYVVFDTAISSEDRTSTGTGVVLRDRTSGTVRLLSRGVSGDLPDGWSAGPAISDDGATIVFTSAATDLVRPDANGSMPDIYLVRQPGSIVTRISVNTQGLQPSAGSSVTPDLSAGGRFVVFSSTAELDAPAAGSRHAAGPRSGRPIWHLFV